MLQGETWEVWQFSDGVGGMCESACGTPCAFRSFRGQLHIQNIQGTHHDPSMIPSQESALHCIEEDLSMKPRTGKQLPGIHATG